MLLLELLKSKANIKISQKAVIGTGKVDVRWLPGLWIFPCVFSPDFLFRVWTGSFRRHSNENLGDFWVQSLFGCREYLKNVPMFVIAAFGEVTKVGWPQLCRWILWCFIYLSIYLFKLENFNAFFPTCPTDANSPLWHTEILKCLTAAQERQREIMW